MAAVVCDGHDAAVERCAVGRSDNEVGEGATSDVDAQPRRTTRGGVRVDGDHDAERETLYVDDAVVEPRQRLGRRRAAGRLWDPDEG